ncbi:MAG: 3-phosphoshikimate 1-carboxyvinyltransferase [Oscillospiraceae bacterium]|nr:3-phosphoshikimate 1-carboxyvinyltransferase [Oscillospiraceae bacterium]
MTVKIYPSELIGEVCAIPSKSELHRILICSAFSDGDTDIVVPGSAYSSVQGVPDDIAATVSCLTALGATIQYAPNHFYVSPVTTSIDSPLLDCKESGSTFRFLLPVAAAVSLGPSFAGSGRLPERPIAELLDSLQEHGVTCSDKHLPFSLCGALRGGVFSIPGDVSSQYLTGLLLALPLLHEDSEVVLRTELHSAAYIDITIQVMQRFGIEIQCNSGRYSIKRGQRYRSPGSITVGGDWSNAAAFLVAGAVGKNNRISVSNLDLDSLQGDRSIISILRSFGAHVTAERSYVTVTSSPTNATRIDIDPIPDLMPVLAILAANSTGETAFYNAQRLRLKESDRILSVENMLNNVGGHSFSDKTTLAVYGNGKLSGGTVDSQNDHRIVMAATIASCLSSSPILIQGAEAIQKSFPTFFDDLAALGGKFDVI